MNPALQILLATEQFPHMSIGFALIFFASSLSSNSHSLRNVTSERTLAARAEKIMKLFNTHLLRHHSWSDKLWVVNQFDSYATEPHIKYVIFLSDVYQVTWRIRHYDWVLWCTRYPANFMMPHLTCVFSIVPFWLIWRKSSTAGSGIIQNALLTSFFA